MNAITDRQIDTLLAEASGNVSFQSNYARTTAVIDSGKWVSKMYARDYLDTLRALERQAMYRAPVRPVVADGPRSRVYAGPFPRGKHSHHCRGCEGRGQLNSVACYKSKCRCPQLTATCSWCEPMYQGADQPKIDARLADLVTRGMEAK